MNRTLTRFALLATSAAALGAARAQAQCQQVWYTGWNNNTIGPSHVAGAENKEVADDFDFVGDVTRLLASGNGPLCCGTMAVDALVVRFYEWTASGPGALQAEYALDGSDPHVVYLPIPQTLDVTLPTPFHASGAHFVSIQVDFASNGYWYWWTGGGVGGPLLSHAWIRDHQAGATWGPFIDIFGNPSSEDVSFELFGDPLGGAICYDWVEIPTPRPSIEHTILRDIDVLAADDVWAVGDQYTSGGASSEIVNVTMHYDGTQWSVVPAPNPSACAGCATVWFEAVEAVAPNDVWAAGTQRIQDAQGFLGGQILVERWNGSQWNVVPTPVTSGSSGSIVYDIEVVSQNDVWFFGELVQNGQPALAMHWDGSGFTIVPTPNFAAGGHSLEAGSALASDDIWAVGGGGDGDAAAFSYIVHWDGSSWTHVPGPTVGLMQRLLDVVALAPDDVWVCGEAWFAGSIDAFFQHWDGSSWSNVSVPGGGGALLAFGPNDIWSSGGNLVHYDGTSWTVASGLECIPGASLGALDGVASTSGGPSELWAAGRQISAGLIPLTVRYAGGNQGGASPVSYYCQAQENSVGCTPILSSAGCACDSQATSKTFALTASHLLGNKSGLFFYGTNGPAEIPFQGGYLCIAPPFKRSGVQNSGGTPGLCDGALTIDFNDVIASGVDASLQFGAQVSIQAWSRDPQHAAKTNLTSARLFAISP